MALWLLALTQERRTPRRLVYVTFTESAVDRVADDIAKIVARLDIVKLRQLTPTGDSVRIVKMPGDDHDWRADPASPTVIVGSTSTLLRRLLFSGAGDSTNQAPILAGLLGQDALWLLNAEHDHAQALTVLSSVQRTQGDKLRPLMVWSASILCENSDTELTPEEAEQDPALRALRTVELHDVAEKDMETKMAESALKHEGTPGVVYVACRTPERATKVFKKLETKEIKKEGRALVLTGTYRGHERRLLNDQLAALIPQGSAKTVYVVGTSAVDYGQRLHASTLICDPCSLPAFVRRISQATNTSEVPVRVFIPKKGKERLTTSPEIQSCLTYLENHAKVSVATLLASGVTATLPAGAPVDEAIFDSLSMTNFATRPPVHRLLTLPNTQVTHRTKFLYREEVRLFADELPREHYHPEAHRLGRQLTHHLESGCPPTWDELVSVNAWEAQKVLGNCEVREPVPALVITKGYGILYGNFLRANVPLADTLIVLPPDKAFLEKDGLFSKKMRETTDIGRPDIVRVLLSYRDGAWRTKVQGPSVEGPDGPIDLNGILAERPDQVFQAIRERLGASWSLRSQVDIAPAGENAKKILACFGDRPHATSYGASQDQELTLHQHQVSVWAERFGETLGLAPELVEALRESAQWHDAGKGRSFWQRALGNSGAALAKSKKKSIRQTANKYDHEIGSLIDARKTVTDPLALHLIAAHHGRARPFLKPRKGDPDAPSKVNYEAAFEAMTRFCDLQRMHGHWGLAWLESLLRAADVQASIRFDEPSE